jgi:O-antigen/teichoic acid export membrane protein
VLNIMIVVGIVTDAGLATLGVREYTTATKADRRKLLQSLLGLRIALSVVGVAIALGIVYLTGATSLVVWGALASGIGLLLAVVQSTVGIPLLSELRFAAVTVLDAVRQALLAAAYVVLALIGIGLGGFYAAVLPAQLIVLLLTVAAVGTVAITRPRIDLTVWRRFATAGIAFALAVAVGALNQYAAQVLTAVVSSEYEAGLFATALRVYIVVGAIPGIIVSSALPVLARSARDDPDRFAYAMRLLVDAMIVLSGALGLALTVGAPTVVKIVGGPAFDGAVPATMLVGICVVITSIIAAWGFALIAIHRHLRIALANAVALCCSVALTLMLAASHGATGAAVATVVAEVVLACGYGFGLRRAGYAVGLSRRVAILVPVTFAIGAGILLVPGLPNLIAVALAVVFYAGVTITFRLLPGETLDLLPQVMRKRLGWAAR